MRRLLGCLVLVFGVVAGCSDADGEDAGVVQLRPVIGAAEGCKDLSENPPPDEPVSLELSGRCVGLAPSVLTIEKAEMRAAQASQTGVVSARVNLTDKDARTLAAVSRQFTGKEVGLVAFGRLLVAPVFSEPITDGELEILGLSKPEIDALQKALAP
jgi:preprotein translocase subunit SecD